MYGLILPKTEAELCAVKTFGQLLNVAFEDEPKAENFNPEISEKNKYGEEDF